MYKILIKIELNNLFLLSLYILYFKSNKNFAKKKVFKIKILLN